MSMDQVDIRVLVDIGLKCYAVPSRPTWMTLRSRSRTWKFVLKFLVKVFISLYLLDMSMYQVDTLRVGRHWS